MAIYTVHVPDDASDLVTQADRTAFLCEGFSFWGFLFGLVYLLWHRLWLAASIWIVLLLALAAVAFVLHPPHVLIVALFALMHCYLGLEAHDFRRWALARRDFRLADIVSASRLEDAELIFFGRQQAKPTAPRPTQRVAPLPSTPAVIGMFPDGSGV